MECDFAAVYFNVGDVIFRDVTQSFLWKLPTKIMQAVGFLSFILSFFKH